MIYYAQIDENNLVVGLSELAGEVHVPGMIQIDSYDLSLAGKLWDGTGFIENPNPPPTLEELMAQA